jgi:hypothetical protein
VCVCQFVMFEEGRQYEALAKQQRTVFRIAGKWRRAKGAGPPAPGLIPKTNAPTRATCPKLIRKAQTTNSIEHRTSPAESVVPVPVSVPVASNDYMSLGSVLFIVTARSRSESGMGVGGCGGARGHTETRSCRLQPPANQQPTQRVRSTKRAFWLLAFFLLAPSGIWSWALGILRTAALLANRELKQKQKHVYKHQLWS